MSDLLLTLANRPGTARILKTLGLPSPTRLTRENGGFAPKPLNELRTLLLSPEGSPCQEELIRILSNAGADQESRSPLEAYEEETSQGRFQVIVYDGTMIREVSHYRSLYDHFHRLTNRLSHNAKVVLLARDFTSETDPELAALSRGVEGFTKSLAKEIGKKGSTANLIYVNQGTDSHLEMPLRFLCSHHSAFISGQALRLNNQLAQPDALPLTNTLSGKMALVTGCAGGIGAETAHRLSQEGCQVICLDIPAVEDSLNHLANEINGIPLPLDITQPDAIETLSSFIRQHSDGLDVIVHNAGITRDKSLAKMPAHYWDSVISVNLAAILKIDQHLIKEKLIKPEGRIICLSSISGIAGNFGQSNYATTKAALMGYAKAQAQALIAEGITVNAIAPGFIETNMTAAMPVLTREAGRRLNALSQGGPPRDVAEAIAFMASPGAYGVTGQTLRVCGLGIMGA
ncbi:3-oxoacyl-ACP reductase [Hahella ganghwensis]|uniref:3-oxoacyl-ACP reductase n=1 Tax=Hahella ganghwensis TaxID=286420 RepID=UPI0003692C3E|nr:3-oxoacyl-ACP reductase [Hahella ganghwensis]